MVINREYSNPRPPCGCMGSEQGLSFGGPRRFAFRVAFLAGIALAVASYYPASAGAVITRESTSSPGLPLNSSACSTLFSIGLPELNFDKAQFETICNEPAFANAAAEWGWSNFSLGSTSSPSYLVYYPSFTWTRNCSAPWGCSDEIYWTLNVTSGNVSGPTTVESGPTACYGCPATTWPAPSEGRGPLPIPVWVVGVVGAGTAGAACYLLVVRKRLFGARK